MQKTVENANGSVEELITAIELDEHYTKIKKTPKEIIQVVLVLFLLGLLIQTLMTNQFEDAPVYATFYSEPQQIKLSEEQKQKLVIGKKYKHTEVIIKPQTSYKLSGRIIAKARKFDMLSEVAPYDLGIVTGDLMYENNYRRFRFQQFQRTLIYWISSEKEKGIENVNIRANISHNHIIPANEHVLEGLRKIKKYDKVYLEGFLVYCDVSYKKNPIFDFNSSLSRMDSEGNSCEVFYVTKIVAARGTWE